MTIKKHCKLSLRAISEAIYNTFHKLLKIAASLRQLAELLAMTNIYGRNQGHTTQDKIGYQHQKNHQSHGNGVGSQNA